MLSLHMSQPHTLLLKICQEKASLCLLHSKRGTPHSAKHTGLEAAEQGRSARPWASTTVRQHRNDFSSLAIAKAQVEVSELKQNCLLHRLWLQYLWDRSCVSVWVVNYAWTLEHLAFMVIRPYLPGCLISLNPQPLRAVVFTCYCGKEQNKKTRVNSLPSYELFSLMKNLDTELLGSESFLFQLFKTESVQPWLSWKMWQLSSLCLLYAVITSMDQHASTVILLNISIYILANFLLLLFPL